MREFVAEVIAVDADAIALNATTFFATGGGQPHDTGTLSSVGKESDVVDVVKREGGLIWHVLADSKHGFEEGDHVHGVLDWDRRYLVMRTHTALHILNGIIWRDYRAHVTGAHMTPGEGRLDFELPAISRQFGDEVEMRVTEVVNENLAVRVLFLPRSEADRDPSLLRLKVDLIPRSIDPLRVIDIVGLDRQADGGTHVASTGEVEEVRVVKTESKGKANKRIRIVIEHAASSTPVSVGRNRPPMKIVGGTMEGPFPRWLCW
jgi:misacylated tRNA(Ala) deacylase